jgi:transcriptional regulator with XRE-family HTH domain
MKKKFAELKARMSPEARARAEARTREMMADMLLGEVRELVGLTQEELARKLGVKQPTLSRLESQEDMQISTLQRLVKALGGELEIVVHLPAGDIRIQQFAGLAHP